MAKKKNLTAYEKFKTKLNFTNISILIMFISVVLFQFIEWYVFLLVPMFLIFLSTIFYTNNKYEKILGFISKIAKGEFKFISNLLKKYKYEKIKKFLLLYYLIDAVFIIAVFYIAYIFLLIFVLGGVVVYGGNIYLGLAAMFLSAIILYPSYYITYLIFPRLSIRHYNFLIYYSDILKNLKSDEFSNIQKSFIQCVDESSKSMPLDELEKLNLKFLSIYLRGIFNLKLTIEDKKWIINKLKDVLEKRDFDRVLYESVNIDKYLSEKSEYKILLNSLYLEYNIESKENNHNLVSLHQSILSKNRKTPLNKKISSVFSLFSLDSLKSLLIIIFWICIILAIFGVIEIPDKVMDLITKFFEFFIE
jgi:hypothetical protein